MNRLARLIRGRRLWPWVVAAIAALALVSAVVLASSDTWPFEADSPTTTDRPASTDRSTTTNESPDVRSGLAPNDDLVAGDALVSEDGRHTLTMDDSGRLIGRTQGVADPWFWVPADDGALRAGSFAYMGGDSNFVIYGARDPQNIPTDPRWSLGTGDEPDGAHVEVRDIDGEGHLVLVGTDDQVIDTFQRPVPSAGVPETEPDTTPATSPSSTTESTDGSTTSITVATETVPNVRGQTASAARLQLEAEPYRYQVKTLNESDAVVAVGRVTRTQPASGEPLAPGSAIDLYVSRGP